MNTAQNSPKRGYRHISVIPSSTRHPAAKGHYVTKDGRDVLDKTAGSLSAQLYRLLPIAVSEVNTLALPESINVSDRFVVSISLADRADIEHPVGMANIVETGSTDRIVWAKKDSGCGYSRLVVGRQPAPTDTVTMIIKRRHEAPGKFILLNAWCGIEPPELWHDDRSEESDRFWENHAFLFEYTPILAATITEQPPET